MVLVMVRVFNATFNNISVILVEETGVPGKTTDLPQATNKLYHIMLSQHVWWQRWRTAI